MAELVTQNETQNMIILKDSDILNPEYDFDDKITVATKVASSLKKVIETQELAVQIGKDKEGNPNMYVTAEGWEVLGTMLGCTPYVEEVTEIPSEKPKFMYQATVSIRHGDTVLSRASAIAERNNKQKERPFVYSMAQTRALGKAYRMALSWIIKMAGYEPTPAEEMPRFKPDSVVEAEIIEKINKTKAREEEEESFFTTADKVETLDFNPVAQNWIKTAEKELTSKGESIDITNVKIQLAEYVKTGQLNKELCPDIKRILEETL